MLPIARLSDLTISGDSIVSPGCPTVLVGGIAVSCVGDAVAGSVCAGAVEKGVANVFIGGKPVATVNSVVVGSNVQTGSPMKTAVAFGFKTVFVRP